jgi:hypothetical protein
MPEPLSTLSLGLLFGYGALQAAARSSNAVSAEARDLDKSRVALVESTEKSLALFGNKAVALSQLYKLESECAEAGWDGHDGQPIQDLAVLWAAEFIRALPDGIPLPEFTVDPDGAVSLDWVQSRTRLFTLSIGSNSRVALAWVDGINKGHAVERFDGQSVPWLVIDRIKEIMNCGDARLRVA